MEERGVEGAVGETEWGGDGTYGSASNSLRVKSRRSSTMAASGSSVAVGSAGSSGASLAMERFGGKSCVGALLSLRLGPGPEGDGATKQSESRSKKRTRLITVF